MRKATGKVVSLVLALALVITSFSATFASAATTSETGIGVTVSNGGYGDTIYLANLNGMTTADAEAAKDKNRDKFDLSDFINVTEIETYDHIKVNDVEVTSVSLSGDSVIKVTKDSDDTYTATLRSDNATGTAYVNVLYTGKGDRGDNEITVRATKKFTIVVLDANAPILSSTATVTDKNGKELGGLNALDKNPAISGTDWAEKSGEDAVTYDTAYVYLPSTSAAASNDAVFTVGSTASTNNGSAVVTYAQQNIVLADTLTNGRVQADAATVKYAVTSSGSDKVVKVSGNAITYGIADPSVGNTLRLTISTIEDATKTEDSGTKYATLKKTVEQETVKVENTVSGEITAVKMGDGSKHTVGLGKKGDTITSKSKIYAVIMKGSEEIWWDVTGANLIQEGTGLSISDGRLASVDTKGDLTLTDATVTGKAKAAGTVSVTGGTAGSVEGTTITLSEGAVVSSIDDSDATLVINNGKVSGTVKVASVNLDPEDEDSSASVGAVTANSIIVDGEVGTATVSSFTAKSKGTVTLIGTKASIGAIDDDFYGITVDLQNFAGTVPAIKDGYFTEYDQTGARLSVNDNNSGLDATNATVNGALKIRYIDLNGGAVTFNSSVEVNELTGGEADLIVNAGALRITEVVATSNTLKLANAADVKAGTVVFYTTSDIADVDSFVRYGYELKVTSSGSYDVYTISDVDFAGLTLDATSIELVKGEKAVVTASAYPAGTNLPEGAKIAFYFNGDDSYVKGYKINDTQAELVAVEYNSEFSVLNEGTLTAQVEDEYGIQLEEYGEATCKVKVVAQKAPTETYKSDTTGDVVVAKGNTYQFKITSLNGQTPSVVLGSDGVFELVGTSQEGSDYFFKFQAVGASGAATGVYVNGDAKVATLYVDGNTGYTCDTTTVNVPAGGTYQVKITAASMPTLLPGNSIYTVAFASQEGNDYFFKITATSAQAGDVVGFYINGGARAFVATTV